MNDENIRNRNQNQVSQGDFEPTNNNTTDNNFSFDPHKYLAGEMLHAVERTTSSWFDKWKCNLR
jgi:hypothetical protein